MSDTDKRLGGPCKQCGIHHPSSQTCEQYAEETSASMNQIVKKALDTIPAIKINEDPMKTLIRKVIAEGREQDEFKKSVRKHLIKTSTNTRELTSMRIKESHKRIDAYWKEIKAETLKAERELI